jgi:hypothetical protein
MRFLFTARYRPHGCELLESRQKTGAPLGTVRLNWFRLGPSTGIAPSAGPANAGPLEYAAMDLPTTSENGRVNSARVGG